MRAIRKNKKGQSVLDLFMFIAVAFVILIFFAAWKYGFHTLTTSLTAIETPANNLGINISSEAQNTFGYVDIGLNGLNVIGYCMIFGMILTILISSFLVRANPVFFVGYVLIVIVAVILSFVISNSYEFILNNSVIGDTMNSYTIGTYIMLNLGTWVAVVGFIGAILLFAGIMIDRDSGGSLG